MINLSTLFTQLGELAQRHGAFVQAVLSMVSAAYRARNGNPWRAATLRFLRHAAPYLSKALATELARLERIK